MEIIWERCRKPCQGSERDGSGPKVSCTSPIPHDDGRLIELAFLNSFNGKGKFTQADPILKGPVQNLEDLEDGMVTENVVTVEVSDGLDASVLIEDDADSPGTARCEETSTRPKNCWIIQVRLRYILGLQVSC